MMNWNCLRVGAAALALLLSPPTAYRLPPTACAADEPATSAATVKPARNPAKQYLDLLKGGRVQPDRLPALIGMICERGNGDDLAYIYDRAIDPKAWPPATRTAALERLAEAAVERRIQPASDLATLRGLMHPADKSREAEALQLSAIRLAGLWKVEALSRDLLTLAMSSSPGSRQQTAAIESFSALGDATSRAALSQLVDAKQPQAVRFKAIAALAKVDLDAAAKAAAAALAGASPRDDASAMLDEFLTRQSGPDQLAAALAAVKLDRDVARTALRYMYSIGHSHEGLSNVLSRAAEIPTDEPVLDAEQMAALVEKLVPEMLEKGDAARGELVFRSADLSCQKCHAIAKAGGEVGPDLSAVGATSPPDYILRSILDPNAQKKEGYETRIVVANGLQHVGVQVDRNDQRVRLKDATGRIVVIPTADIEEEEEGRSLMPQGLTKFLTHQETLDLTKFISELGKPGPYEIRTTPMIYRWRVLRDVPEEVARAVPDVDKFRDHVLAAPAESWSNAYSRVSGVLPLVDLHTAAGPNSDNGSHGEAIYLRGEIEVTQAGRAGFSIDAPPGTAVWINVDPFEGDAARRIQVDLMPGEHQVTLRIPASAAGDKSAAVKVELFKPEGTKIEFQPIGGT